MRTIDKIITKVNDRYGAPMGRPNTTPQYSNIVDTPNGRYIYLSKPHEKSVKIFDCAVPMSSDSAYDKGGAYWGIGKQLRVRYTKDLSYVEFYRMP